MRRLFHGSLLSRLLIVEAIVFAVVLVASLLTIRWYAGELRQRIEDERVRSTISLAGEVERTIHEAIALLRTIRTANLPDANIQQEIDRLARESTVITGGVLLTDEDWIVRMSDPQSAALRGARVSPPTIPEGATASQSGASAWSMTVPGRGRLIALTVATDGGGGRAHAVGLIDPVDSGVNTALNRAKQVGGTGHADLIDQLGQTIASSEVGHLTREDHPTFYRAQAKAATRAPTIAQVPEEGDAGELGEDHVMGYAPVPVFGWGVTLGGDVATTFAPLRQLWIAAAALAGGFTVVALGATYIGSVQMVRPVRRLSDAARRVAAGDLDAEIASDTGGEIGQLGESVDSMRRELAGWGRELEVRVGERTAELETRSRELAASASVARAASSTLEMSSLLEHTVEELRTQLGVDGVSAWVAGDGRRPALAYSSPHLPVESPPAIPACKQCAELGAGPGWCPLPSDGPCFVEGYRSRLTMPLRSLDRPVGILCLLRRAPVGESARELEIAASVPLLAAEMSMGIGNAILYGDVRWREEHRQHLLGRILGAQEEERRRLARELHDDTGQALIGIMLSLDSLTGTLASADGEHEGQLRDRLSALRATSDEALANLRRMILALRPSALDDIGLIAAIRRYATATLPPAGIDVVVQSAVEELKLSPDAETLVFRIVQESINNVVRHSQARNAVVEVVEDDATLIVRTHDDGVGLAQAVATSSGDMLSGVGIEGMRERAELLGATLTVVGAAGKGTTVELRIPRGLEIGETHGS